MMLFCVICTLRGLYLPHEQINPRHLSSDRTKELKDLHGLTFNSLSALLVTLTLTGSKTLLPVALALLVYTMSLRLAVSTCFVQDHPALAKILYIAPLLGTFCTAAVELASEMKSPALGVVIFLLSVLPFLTIVAHHGGHCEQTPLPVRVQDPLSSIV